MEELIQEVKVLAEAQVQQQRTQQCSQEELIAIIKEQLEILKTNKGNSNFFTAEGIANSISEFKYSSEEGITFPEFYRRFETIFSKRCASWSDEQKVSLLLQKLGTDENTKYTNLILQKKKKKKKKKNRRDFV